MVAPVSEEDRQRVVDLVRNGYRLCDIAEELDVNTNTVQKIITKYRKETGEKLFVDYNKNTKFKQDVKLLKEFRQEWISRRWR